MDRGRKILVLINAFKGLNTLDALNIEAELFLNDWHMGRMILIKWSLGRVLFVILGPSLQITILLSDLQSRNISKVFLGLLIRLVKIVIFCTFLQPVLHFRAELLENVALRFLMFVIIKLVELFSEFGWHLNNLRLLSQTLLWRLIHFLNRHFSPWFRRVDFHSLHFRNQELHLFLFLDFLVKNI